MKLKCIVSWFLNFKSVDGAIFFVWKKLFTHIICVRLEKAEVSLWKIFTKIWVCNEEDPIIIFWKFISEDYLLLRFNNISPKFFISLTSLALPFSISPRISQFEHSILFSISMFNNSCINLNYCKNIRVCMHAQVQGRVVTNQYFNYRLFHNNKDSP